jgi:hypothetical protein
VLNRLANCDRPLKYALNNPLRKKLVLHEQSRKLSVERLLWANLAGLGKYIFLEIDS